MSNWSVVSSDGDTVTLLDSGENEEQFEVYIRSEGIFVYTYQLDGTSTEIKLPREDFETFLREVNELVFPYQNEGT